MSDKTFIFKTSLGNEVELKKYLTAREHWELKKYVERRMKGQVIGQDATMDFEGEMIVQQELEQVRAYLVSWKGIVTNAFDTFMDSATGQEFEEVSQAVADNIATEKKDPSTSETPTETSSAETPQT